ncbi:MAG TPA: nitroreductase [Alphaproteobacteria bacterium]|nr:nitroreductase [Alphaproteobacteria bacterium]
METIDLLLTRRSTSVRLITDPGPTDEQLELILRAATRVPDHGKLAPWRIQVLRGEGQRRLGDFLAGMFAAEIADANDKQIAFERERPQRAPLLLVVTSKIRKHHKIPEMEQLLSGAAVCQNILVAAQALGVAANWITEWPAYRKEVVRHLGHDPETDRIIGFIYLGTASEKPDERPRPALDEVVSEWQGVPDMVG